MLVDIAAGKVGAVFCSHSSRLARNARDMQTLIVFCEATGTLIVDANGAYDAQNENDRFFLDIKGVFDEAEARRIKSQMWDAIIAKAKKGQFHIHLPVGYVWSGPGDDAKIVFDPNQRVQNAVRQIFDLLEQLGSASAVARYINDNKILFPTRVRIGSHQEGDYEWKRLSLTRLTKIYCNPVYAGAYVFGKFRLRSEVVKSPEGDKKDPMAPPEMRTRIVKVKPEEWLVHIPNNHQGYIDWRRLEQNQQRLKDNRSRPDSPGAAKDGAALLTRIAFCDHCERKMDVVYPKRQKSYYYRCHAGTRIWGETKGCQYTSCIPVDEAVTAYLLEAFKGGQVEVALESARYIEEQAQKKIKDLKLRLENAKYEEVEAKSRYKMANHRNRLVVEDLESEWELKKVELDEAKRDLERASNSSKTLLSASEHAAVLSLAGDIPKLWYAKQMTNVLRKRILRLLIERVGLSRADENYKIRIHWRTGACTEISTPVRKAKEYNRTDPKVVEVVRELAPRHTDKELAERLNELGLKPRHNECFTSSIVRAIRSHYDIHDSASTRSEKSLPSEQNTEGRLTVSAVADLLNLNRSLIVIWCRQGKLDAVQHTTKRMWWIKLNREDIERLRSRNFSRELGEDLTDAQWECIAPLLPVPPRPDNGHGQPRCGNREIINAVLWKLRSYARWLDLPDRFPAVDIYNRRFREWVKNGVLVEALQALAEELRSQGNDVLSACYLDAVSVTKKKFRPKRTGKPIFLSN